MQLFDHSQQNRTQTPIPTNPIHPFTLTSTTSQG
jgi:hypothetical protein